MATTYHKWKGAFKWAKVHEGQKDTQFDERGWYSLNLYPQDKATWKDIDASGIKVKRRTDEDGEFIQLKRIHEGEIGGSHTVFGPPKVFIMTEDGPNPFGGAIGNGSKGVVNVALFDSRYGKGHRLNSILVTDLVEYEGGNGGNREEMELPF